MREFINKHIYDNKDGINGLVTILFTALCITTFEILFFMNVGLKDIKTGIHTLKGQAKKAIDENLLGNKDYCEYLYNSKKTKHSQNIYDTYCKKNENIYKKKEKTIDLTQKYNNIMSSIKNNYKLLENNNLDSTFSNAKLGKYGEIYHGYDAVSQLNNIETLITSLTDLVNPKILMSSIYDYYKKHPEFMQSSSVVKNLLSNKFNTEVNRNAWELLSFIFLIITSITGLYYLKADQNQLDIKRILINFFFVSLFIIMFQIYFYFNVTKDYYYEGTELAEIIEYYKKNSAPLS